MLGRMWYIIDCPVCSHFFQSYLEEEISSENLLCYKSIRVMSSVSKEAEKRMKMDAIYHNFVKVGSEMEVNIDSRVRKAIDDARAENRPVPEMERLFTDVAQQLYHNLETDTFPRFQTSQTFRDLVDMLQSSYDTESGFSFPTFMNNVRLIGLISRQISLIGELVGDFQ